MPLGGCSPGWHHKKFAYLIANENELVVRSYKIEFSDNCVLSMNWFSSSVLTRERLGKRGTRCPVLNFLFLRGENWFLS